MWDALRQILAQSNVQPLVDPHVLVDEFDNINNGTSIDLSHRLSFPALITSIIAAIPATATGALQIGIRQIPLAAGLNPGLQQIQMVVFPADIITLTSSLAGNIYLEIMGGRLMNDEWRRV